MQTKRWSTPTLDLNPVELLKYSTDFLAKGILDQMWEPGRPD
ncbi:MAG: hypothetical protein ABSF44_06560 [Candidatus Bathyarchaeia archaeon]